MYTRANYNALLSTWCCTCSQTSMLLVTVALTNSAPSLDICVVCILWHSQPSSQQVWTISQRPKLNMMFDAVKQNTKSVLRTVVGNKRRRKRRLKIKKKNLNKSKKRNKVEKKTGLSMKVDAGVSPEMWPTILYSHPCLTWIVLACLFPFFLSSYQVL